MKRSQKTGLRMAALTLAASSVLVLASPAFAGDAAPRSAGARGAVSGLQAAIDPATGQLRPLTPAEARVLLAQARSMTKAGTSELQFTTWADGTISAVLTPEYLNVWLAQIGADGSLNQLCVDGVNAVAADPNAAPALEEK